MFLPADLSLQLMSDISNHNQAEIHVLKPREKSYDFYFPLAKVVPMKLLPKNFLCFGIACALWVPRMSRNISRCWPQNTENASHTTLTALPGLLLRAGWCGVSFLTSTHLCLNRDKFSVFSAAHPCLDDPRYHRSFLSAASFLNIVSG